MEMKMLRLVTLGTLAALLAASPLSAQSGRKQDGVPPGHRPPAGLCRIWIDGVPPGQQAAPTDCGTAVRNRPANGRVLFGDENAKPGKKDGFTPSRLRDGEPTVTGSGTETAEKGKSETAKAAGKAKAKKSRATAKKPAEKKINPKEL